MLIVSQTSSLGLFDFLFWSSIAIGLWGALGTPGEWQFSSVLAALQPVGQCIALVALTVHHRHEMLELAAANGAPPPRGGEGAEFFIMVAMAKNFVVVILTIALARLGVRLFSPKGGTR